MEISIAIPYTETAYGTVYVDIELPEGMSPQDYLEAVKTQDIDALDDAVGEDWVAEDSSDVMVGVEGAEIVLPETP